MMSRALVSLVRLLWLEKGRDQWVYAINSALLKYEKDCAQARREAAALTGLESQTVVV